MHVFQGHGPLEFAGFDLFLDFRQAVDDGVALFVGEHAHFRQHGGVGLGTVDVLTVHALVKIHAGGEFLHELVGGFAEAAAPEFVLLLVSHRLAHLKPELRARSIAGTGRPLNNCVQEEGLFVMMSWRATTIPWGWPSVQV